MPTYMLYALRQIDGHLWRQFKERARAENFQLRDLLLKLIASYVEKGVPK